MEDRKKYIEMMRQMIAIVKGLQADILVVKEYIARDIIQKQEGKIKEDELLETAIDAKDDKVYMVNPEKMLRYTEQYKI